MSKKSETETAFSMLKSTKLSTSIEERKEQREVDGVWELLSKNKGNTEWREGVGAEAATFP